MKITFGIINYNRLFYLKSCAESLMKSLEGYEGELEFICIDDNSKESGTKQYLKTLEKRGWTVINQEDTRTQSKTNIKIIKDVIDEFSNALNLFYERSTGDYIVPLQGDMQFIRKGWLNEYVKFLQERDDVLAVMLDAQRTIRLEDRSYNKVKSGDNIFAVQNGRIIPGAGDCFYNKQCLDRMGGWVVGLDDNAEDIFTILGKKLFRGKKKVYVPWFPVSISIQTDPRGTNGRVRGNMRYGKYWEALEDDLYYKFVDKKDYSLLEDRPFGIEDLVVANGDWELPIDDMGRWKKNPINWPVESDVECNEIT